MDTAVILAGGLGTRLRPVTYEIPKPLIPVQGRALTEHVLDILKEHGVTKVILAIGYMADRIEAYFGDGSRFGLDMEYLVEEEPLGTGGWMRLMQERGLVPDGDFIVVNGDNLFDLDLAAMHALHEKTGAAATIGLTSVANVSSRSRSGKKRRPIASAPATISSARTRSPSCRPGASSCSSATSSRPSQRRGSSRASSPTRNGSTPGPSSSGTWSSRNGGNSFFIENN